MLLLMAFQHELSSVGSRTHLVTGSASIGSGQAAPVLSHGSSEWLSESILSDKGAKDGAVVRTWVLPESKLGAPGASACSEPLRCVSSGGSARSRPSK